CTCLRVQHQHIPDYEEISHLVISGSEASITEKYPWYEYLENVLKEIIESGKPVLGICYGHQFLARTLIGTHSVRKSLTPEFGWMPVKLMTNPLFRGITEPVFMLSHYDEVAFLNNDFLPVATSELCRIHGFQIKGKPVWGIQFHPEYGMAEADEIFRLIQEYDPKFDGYFYKNDVTEEIIAQNEKIFSNFLSVR
ncbi:MAG: gamma-glutamyl-gamma-aminobutyrate hydrolase family protein, partial [Bacteroidetes bacterium]|nr:gamma-glutamyl-gamma-aminobutyrate hydrolase family protein [Bacteroidota bacterium]